MKLPYLLTGGLFDERQARVGIILGPLLATYYGSAGILTGSLVNIIITEFVESSGGPVISWTEWLLWLGPVMSVGRVLVIIGFTYVLYRPRDREAVDVTDRDLSIQFSPRERRLVLYLLMGVTIWATDFVHGLHPLFGAIVVVLLTFAPRIGVADPDVVRNTDFSILFFLGAVFAIAEGLQQVQFTNVAAGQLLRLHPTDGSLALVLVAVVLVSLGLELVMEGIAVASVITPVLVTFATDAGIPLVPVVMMEAMALNTHFFPHQSAVLVAILGLDIVDAYELTRMAILHSVGFLVLLFPVQIGLFVLFFG